MLGAGFLPRYVVPCVGNYRRGGVLMLGLPRPLFGPSDLCGAYRRVGLGPRRALVAGVEGEAGPETAVPSLRGASRRFA